MSGSSAAPWPACARIPRCGECSQSSVPTTSTPTCTGSYGSAPEPELVALLAELDARAEADGIDEETAKQLLLRLRERRLGRELEAADEAQFQELQHKLAEIRTAIREFA